MLHVDWKTWRCAQCAWMPSEATDNIQAENAVKGHIAYHYASAPAGERATIWCSGCGTRCPFPEGFLLDGVVHLCGDCWRHVQPVLHRRQAPSVLAPVGESMSRPGFRSSMPRRCVAAIRRPTCFPWAPRPRATPPPAKARLRPRGCSMRCCRRFRARTGMSLSSSSRWGSSLSWICRCSPGCGCMRVWR